MQSLQLESNDEVFELETEHCNFYSEGVKLFGKLTYAADIKTQDPLPTVILVPGIGGRKEWFEPVFTDAICHSGLALFSFDLRGHAPSQGALDVGIISDIYAAVGAARAYRLVDDSRIILAGQCLGSLLCNHYAANKHDVLGVANISTFLPEVFDKMFTREVNDSILDQIVKSETHDAVLDYDGFYQGFAQRCCVKDNALANADLPSLFVHYENDPICTVQRLRSYLDVLNNPNNELCVLENEHKTWISKLPHAISYDDPEVASLLVQWIKRKIL